MIAVGIIGILASIAAPSYTLFVDQARYGRARGELGTFLTLLEAARAANDSAFIDVSGTTMAASFWTEAHAGCPPFPRISGGV